MGRPGQTSGISLTAGRDHPAGVGRLAIGVINASGGQLSATTSAHSPRIPPAATCSRRCRAITHIGKGPNFMVKTIAEQHHVRTPSLFGYLVCSVGILVPVMVAVSVLVF
jgi:hypothetical protein